jgi:hypothetical protein
MGLSVLLTGCVITDWDVAPVSDAIESGTSDPRYGQLVDSGHQIPALDLNEIGRDLLRATVS